MQTQDKIAVDIGQISQETLKSYDRWRFFKYLFAGILVTFIVFLVSLFGSRPRASVFAFCVRSDAFRVVFDHTCLSRRA